MGLDVYSYIMVGVQANKVISSTVASKAVTYYNRHTGQPEPTEERYRVFVFQGKEYPSTYGNYSQELVEVFEKAGLELKTFEGFFYPQDTIGLVVCDNSNQGGDKYETTTDELQIMLEDVRRRLLAIGIKLEPEIRLVMHWSE